MTFHPIVYLFDSLPPSARAKLREQIRRHGCHTNIVAWNGQIIHGGHQAEILEELGREFTIVEFTGTELEAIEYALSLSEERLRATAAQRALAGTKLVAMLRVAGYHETKVTQKAAELVAVSPRSVESAKAVLDKGAPELLQAVRDGLAAVSDAGKITRLLHGRQIEAVNAVRKGEAKTLTEAAEPYLAEMRGDAPRYKDDIGTPVPSHLTSVFVRRDEIIEFCRLLEESPSRVRRLAPLID
jgi:hypothetical protein